MTIARGKYASLIDEQTWAFIDKTLAYYPSDAENQPMTAQRKIYNTMCKGFNQGRPSAVSAHDYEIAVDSTQTIALREYTLANSEPEAQVLYLHGGGFILGNLDSHDDVCAEICANTGCLVTAVDYRLAPEYLYPVAFDDAYASFQSVTKRHNLPLILAGDSAGANLAASVAHRSRHLSKQAIGQLLIYPVIGSDYTQGSYIEHANAPMLSTSDMLFYQNLMTGGNDEILCDPVFSPLNDTDFSGLPPTLIFTAQCDPLAGDGLIYCNKIRAAGGVANCTEEAGLVHGYLRARHSVDRARESFQRMIEGIQGFINAGFLVVDGDTRTES